MTHPVTKKAENSWDEPMLCLHITVLIWVFRHFSLVKSAKNPKMSVMGKMVFMHKQRFPKCSLLKMWYITAWRSYKTHRILDRWKMALQFDSSVTEASLGMSVQRVSVKKSLREMGRKVKNWTATGLMVSANVKLLD